MVAWCLRRCIGIIVYLVAWRSLCLTALLDPQYLLTVKPSKAKDISGTYVYKYYCFLFVEYSKRLPYGEVGE